MIDRMTERVRAGRSSSAVLTREERLPLVRFMDTREVCTGNIEAHAAQALQNLDRVLKAAGVERSQVVFCRVYTPSNEYWGPINALYAQFFGEHKPGRVVVSTTPLHFGCLVEIECIAELEAHD